ncbi:hypothetical protein K2173_018385 [Erythroxylum novogranatense]|uniref:FRIGIDA-like protein n=1 Tax=Erythroxylum novogranatense TaxID=1862640 RepID=A0AAV8UEZ9_9ROSI|nr:hypothetical protein K2173_018385 [Erythroxylum novogranatense]
MEYTESVASLINSTSSKIEQLQKAFAELESHRAVTLNLKWKEIEEHFHCLERSLKRRFHELEDQEKEYERKTRKAQEMLKKCEASVMAKEQDSLERLQEKRDAAMLAIAIAENKHRKVSSVKSVDVTNDDHGESPTIEYRTTDAMAGQSNLEEIKDSPENTNMEVVSYPQLLALCKEMDSEGLHKFISDNRKNLAVLKEEIPFALKTASNPAELVLNSLDHFYRVDVPNIDGKKDSNLLGLRRTCIMLMECLSIVLTYEDLVSVSDVISADVKKRAKAIAEEWKPKLDALDVDASNGNSLEAHAFLQLLATFGIASNFDEEELSRLIPMVSRRRQAAELCRFLGLSDKMPGVIKLLVNSGRQIDAVNLAFAFELTEQFLPVPLLKSYLEARKFSSLVKSGNTSPMTLQNEINERELTALKAMIKCIEEHKLEEQYPVDPLQTRLLLLEKTKAHKKTVTETGKPQPKRPRASVGCRPCVMGTASDKTFYPRVTDKYPQYVYGRPYVYPSPADSHVPQFVGSATYSFSPSYGSYFGNGYQYQTPYLH